MRLIEDLQYRARNENEKNVELVAMYSSIFWEVSEFRDTSQKMQTFIQISRKFANSCATFPEISEIAETTSIKYY